jgi:hypothetical protein
MIDLLIKGGIAIGAGVAAWYADKKVKEKTGRHIHEHAVDFVRELWGKLRNWAQSYLAEHETIRKIYASPIQLAAAIKRAQNKCEKMVRMKIYGEEIHKSSPVTLIDDPLPLPEALAMLSEVKRNPNLAIRY